MCGFAGFVDPSLPGTEAPRDLIRTMAGTLQRRGPDDEGFWDDAAVGLFLGFRRLAILDLSQAGHQPMVSHTGRYVIVFNGEVYNFQEIRRELAGRAGTFRGDSDTEVLLAAFEAWGPLQAVTRFRGMFAFALYDRERREVWLGRDRMGIKPLYVAGGEGWLAFGSELRALLEHPRVERRGNPDAAWHYLRTLYVPAPLSILDGVEKVRPGTLVRFDVGPDGVGGRQEHVYWSLEDVAAKGARAAAPRDRGEVLDRLHELLSESVRLRLVADVPVGALLSGGIDSSLVVALMADQTDRPVRTFTIGFDDPRFDESAVAADVAERLGAEHTAVHMPTSAVRDLVPDLADFTDEPMANPSLLPTLLVSRVAREQVVVALSGDGGDELFGGYNRYLRFPGLAGKAAYVPASLRPSVARLMEAGASLPGVEGVGGLLQRGRFGEQHSFAARLRRVASIVGAPTTRDAYLEFMAVGHPRPPVRTGGRGRAVDYGAFERHDGSLQSRLLLLDQLQYLPDDLLAKVDRASMWVSLEARVPILDHRVVEYSWTVPDACKIGDGRLKRPLRALAERYLPAEVLDRPKMGFTVPLDEWLRHDLSAWLGHRLDTGNLARRGLWDVPAVAKLRDRFLAGAPGLALPLWTVAVLEDWCEGRGVTFG